MWIISSLWLDRLVVKGGTAIYKFYGGKRFSKDLDIDFLKSNIDIQKETLKKSILEPIMSELFQEGLKCEILQLSLKKKNQIMLSTIKTESELMSLPVYVGLDIFFTDNLPPNLELQYISQYPDIPEFKIKVGTTEYLFESKLKALFDYSRHQPRDLYDLYFLSRKYGLKLSKYLSSEKIRELKKIARSLMRYWHDLEEIILGDVPPRKEVFKVLFGVCE